MLLCAAIAATYAMCFSRRRLISKRGDSSGGFGIGVSVMDVTVIVSDILFSESLSSFMLFNAFLLVSCVDVVVVVPGGGSLSCAIRPLL